MSRFVKLEFELIEYGKDGNTVKKQLTFDGGACKNHRYRATMNWAVGTPTDKELKVLRQLMEVLAELQDT